MKLIKKQFFILFFSCLLIGLFCQHVKAEEVDDFTYSVSAQTNKATITKYIGTNSEVIIPDTIDGYQVEGLGSAAFANNTSVKTVKIEAKIVFLPNSTFYQCTALEKTSLPDSLERIAPYAFYGCTSLNSITIPNSVSMIQANAFENCTSLTQLLLPDGLESLGTQVFKGCSSLEQVGTEVNNKGFLCYNGVLFNKEMTELVYYPSASAYEDYVVPDSVEKIRSYAFDKPENLQLIKIPSSVATIEESAIVSTLSNMKIVSEEGSVAEEYAKNSGYTFISGEYVPVDEIELSQDNITIDGIGKTVQLNASVYPENASIKTVTYSSGNPEIATVTSQGLVTAIKAGVAEITVVCDGVTVKCVVQVKEKTSDSDPIPITASFDKSEYKLYATAKTAATLKSTMAGDCFTSIKSADTRIATVTSAGVITGVKAGTTKITAVTKSGKTISATAKVVTPSVKLNLSSIPLQLKKSTTAVKVKTKLSTDSVSKWSSSNSKIITVNAKTGKITAKKTGKAYIIVKMKSGATAKCKVTVQKSPVKTTKLTVNQTKVTLKLKGGKKTFQIAAVKTPVTSLEKVTYKSSNTKVATVSSKGKITAKKAGKATITVKAGKKIKKITVTVKKK